MDTAEHRFEPSARSREAGLTLMELMIAVAVVGVLAAIALPSSAGTSRRARGDAELRLRQEAYHLEYGRYVSTGSSESAAFPVAPSAQARALGALPATWVALRVAPPTATARCAYVMIAGTAGDAPGAIASSTFAYTTPAKNWFYLLGRCDLDGDPALDSYYFASSDEPAVRRVNPGR
jgi:type IV pilus assembly protein PilE